MGKSNAQELPQVNIETSIGAKMIEFAQLEGILLYQSMTNTERQNLQQKRRDVLESLNGLWTLTHTCKYTSTKTLSPTTKIKYPSITRKKV